jgi:hypothetical protein
MVNAGRDLFNRTLTHALFWRLNEAVSANILNVINGLMHPATRLNLFSLMHEKKKNMFLNDETAAARGSRRFGFFRDDSPINGTG